MKALGMSKISTSSTSCASITYVINIDSNLAVGISYYYLIVSCICLRPSENAFLWLFCLIFLLITLLILKPLFYFVVTNNLVKLIWRCPKCEFDPFMMGIICFLIPQIILDLLLILVAACKFILVANTYIFYLCFFQLAFFWFLISLPYFVT